MGQEPFATLLTHLASAIDGFPEPRNGRNTHYSLHDITTAAFACFFCQSPSFLAFQRLQRQSKGTDNARTIFGVNELPTDNQIRSVLDGIASDHLRPAFRSIVADLRHQGVLDEFRGFANTLLVALDGTQFFGSEKIHCDQCALTRHSNGRVSYSHMAMLPAVVAPGRSTVIPLEPEYVGPTENELEAAKRWLTTVAPHYSPHGLTIVADALYAVTPIVNLVLAEEMDFIFTVKPTAHRHLYQEIESFAALGELEVKRERVWTGKRHETMTYRFATDLPLTADANPPVVNWAELTVTTDAGEVVRRFAYVTNHPISAGNIAELIEAGRCRWKIENENINTLKTKGYHFEHNFGHGSRHLAPTLLSLNLLAFLFHTVLELRDDHVAELRKRLPRRDTFFLHLATLTHYLCFASWQSLLRFMIKALTEGPGPPPDPTTVIE